MSTSSLKMLIVEDEAIIALDLESLFASLGAQVTLAFTLEEGLVKALDRFDVALLDVRLRNQEVFPVAKELQAKGVPIVFHSAHIDRADIANDYPDAQVLNKPSRDGDLIEAVTRAAAS